jgi:outer membrane protein W
MKKLVVVLVLLGMVVGMAQAGVQAGRREIQIQGAISSDGTDQKDAKDRQSIQGSLILNYFVAANMSVGATGMFIGTRDPGMGPGEKDSINSTIFLLGRLDFYLGSSDSAVVPYVGGRGGMAVAKRDIGQGESKSDNTITYGPQAGLKIFASENTSWNIEASYTIWTPEAEHGQEKVNYHQATVSVGFSYYF